MLAGSSAVVVRSEAVRSGAEGADCAVPPAFLTAYPRRMISPGPRSRSIIKAVLSPDEDARDPAGDTGRLSRAPERSCRATFRPSKLEICAL
jgi:hypothetical protein